METKCVFTVSKFKKAIEIFIISTGTLIPSWADQSPLLLGSQGKKVCVSTQFS